MASNIRPWLDRLVWHGRILFVCILVFGCDKGPQLGAVQGTVSLDGRPLAGAVIIFEPVAGGPTSHAETDEQGRYELMFAAGQPGAAVGQHRITVQTKRFHIPDSVEKVPARYNTQSGLEREVVAGRQTIDLPLESD